jgi:hypothetical protein
MSNFAATKKFHSRLDATRVPRRDVVETQGGQHFNRQAGGIAYRFSSHFHPYVTQLTQQLVRQGVSGLQAADTDYTADGASLPRTVEIAIDSGTSLVIPEGTPFILPNGFQDPDSEGQIVTLPPNTHSSLSRSGFAYVEDRIELTLTGAMTATPFPGTDFNFPEDTRSLLHSDAKVTFTSGAQFSIDAHQLSLFATQVLLTRGTEVIVKKSQSATLLRRKRRPVLYADFFGGRYVPSGLVQQPYPVNDLDFTSGGAYSVYNWELFFHVPLTIAIHLSRNQRFEDAMRWFHHIFDPTDDTDGPTPERFWKVRPFQSTEVKLIEEILVNLSTGRDAALRDETVNAIEAWKDAPFRPHLVARYRHSAYMFKAVMAYLDNLIAWGDSLFRQDTAESINEAMQLYVLAANILGPRPEAVPTKGVVRPRTYDKLKKELNEFGNALVNVETDIPFDLFPQPTASANLDPVTTTLRSIGKALYFCVPRNDKLLGYWDTVADRLFKIRNSLNFVGIFRQLPLFQPPIDPALLAQAAAAGVDVAAIVSGVNQPLPLVRFQVLVRQASEIVQEVKSLGASLLSAMEKEDGEAMAILRAKHERVVMDMVERVRYGQVQEAIKSKEGLLKSLALAVQRYVYYERQLGKKPGEITLPVLAELDHGSLERMNLTTLEPEVAPREIEVDIAPDLQESGGRIASSHEQRELEELQNSSKSRTFAAELDMNAKLMALIPELGGNVLPMGIGVTITGGGRLLSAIQSYAADYHRIRAEEYAYAAGVAAKIGSYVRREQDWAFQSNLAAGEINQIFKQIRAAEIRQAIAELELKTHRQQMKHAAEIERFLNEDDSDKTRKRTNKALYAWMKREVKGLYSQCFQFAFDIARKAERGLQHELGNPELRYLQFGYLAGNEGLLAGEKLYLDVKRMEMAYHDLNQREYELTKHVSLLQVNPLALLELRTTGSCTVRLDEEVFDMDGPGHYFRRIKAVAVSIPCVTGPYASVNCTLTLLKSSIRKTQILSPEGYARQGAEDDRFSDYFGSLQSIVTSSGQNDSGLFETNLRDERYLPFENSGVISEWQLKLPADPREDEPGQFDYDTISDVIVHIRYTAREGGGLLRKAAVANLSRCIDEARAAGSVQLFSVRHDFPSEWAQFQSQAHNQRPGLTLNFRDEHYPSWSRGRLNKTRRVEILARSSADPVPATIVIFQSGDPLAERTKGTLSKAVSLGDLLMGPLTDATFKQPNGDSADIPTGELKLFFASKSLTDLWVAVTWSGV